MHLLTKGSCISIVGSATIINVLRTFSHANDVLFVAHDHVNLPGAGERHSTRDKGHPSEVYNNFYLSKCGVHLYWQSRERYLKFRKRQTDL